MTEAQIKEMVNWQDNLGLSPLHIAIRNGVLQHVTKLLALGADCNLPDADGNTPLHFAAESGNLEILNAVADSTDDLDLQNNLGETPVLLAAHSGSIVAVVSLTSMDKHVVPADTSITDSRGRSLLMHACISGNLDLVRLILSNREGKSRKLSMSQVSVNDPDAHGVTALMYTAMEGHWHLISLLVLFKANVSAKDEKGFSALHWAAAQGNPATVSALMDCGAVLDELDVNGLSPLLHAVSNDNVEIAELLLDCGAGYVDKAVSLGSSDRMRQVLCDAYRDYLVVGNHLRFSQPGDMRVSGRLTVSVLSAEDIYVDPSAVTDGKDSIMVYAIVEFKSSGAENESSMVAITEAVALSSEKILWNESLQFFLRDKQITKDCLLCIELFATRDHSPITNMVSLRHAAGEDSGAGDEDDETRRARMDAMYKGIQEFELAQWRESSKKLLDEVHFSDHTKRWTQLKDIRKRLSKFFGIHLPLPPVPATHFPCGSIRVSFSRLRSLFRFKASAESWGETDLISLTRGLKLADRGSLKIELDFVPSPIAIADLRGKVEIPITPKQTDLPPIEAPEELFAPLSSEENKLRFATRSEKLAHQAKQHYAKWWSALGGGDTDLLSPTAEDKSFREKESTLMRVVSTISKNFVKVYN